MPRLTRWRCYQPRLVRAHKPAPLALLASKAQPSASPPHRMSTKAGSNLHLLWRARLNRTLGVVGVKGAALGRQHPLHHSQRPVKNHVVAHALGLQWKHRGLKLVLGQGKRWCMLVETHAVAHAHLVCNATHWESSWVWRTAEAGKGSPGAIGQIVATPTLRKVT